MKTLLLQIILRSLKSWHFERHLSMHAKILKCFTVINKMSSFIFLMIHDHSQRDCGHESLKKWKMPPYFLQQLIISMIDIEKTQRKGRFTSIEGKNSHNSWLWLVWEKTLTAFFGKEWYEQGLTHMRAEQALIITLVYKSIYCFNFFFNSLIEVFIILGKTLLTIQSYLIYVTCLIKSCLVC